MKKIIGLSLVFLCLGFSVIAQSNEVLVSEDSTSTETIEECAKRMGMTVAECKAKCAKSCAKTCSKTASADANNSGTQVLSVMAEGQPKACCGSIEDCAKKMGMTVAECKAKCSMVHNGETAEEAQTRVASATDSRSDSKAAPTCNKSSKACCKKKKS